MRELSGEPLRNDHAPPLYVPATQWNCVRCDPDNRAAVSVTTVVWLGQNTEGPHGRCSSCGQKYALLPLAARADGSGLRSEYAPSIEEQLRAHGENG